MINLEGCIKIFEITLPKWVSKVIKKVKSVVTSIQQALIINEPIQTIPEEYIVIGRGL